MAKNKISPENNWGDIMAELEYMRSEELACIRLFEHWSDADLKPLFRDPMKEGKYLRNITSKNPKKRKKALKTAEKFREAMRETFLFIFEDKLTEKQREMLVIFCESSANGALSSIIAGADRSLLHFVTIRSRVYFVEKQLNAGS